MQICGLKTLSPVGLITGWDWTKRADVKRLRQVIHDYRPLLTHLAPSCRTFCQAFHPQKPVEVYTSEDNYKLDMLFAIHIAEIGEYIYSLFLLMAIENPPLSRIFKLKVYVRLHDKPGVFFMTLNYCMYGHRHRESNEMTWKGLKVLTNAPWLAPLGVLRAHFHAHHHLMENHTTWSAPYGEKLCKDDALMHKSAPQWLKLVH